MFAKVYLDPIYLFTVDMSNISIISANLAYRTTLRDAIGYVIRPNGNIARIRVAGYIYDRGYGLSAVQPAHSSTS